MGKRYASILDYLGEPWVGVDVGYEIPFMQNYIVATPTSEHISNILDIKIVNKNATILCEKPITTYITEFERIPKDYWSDIFMVNQYRYYPNLKILSVWNGSTEYNFYNSGNDGLAWDCIQLIHLAKNKKNIRLSNKSPSWQARINGMSLSKQAIDQCYISMLEDFCGGSFGALWDLHQAYKAHKEVLQFLSGDPK
jgi:hypothetical protein